jgi:hypothetical protein
MRPCIPYYIVVRRPCRVGKEKPMLKDLLMLNLSAAVVAAMPTSIRGQNNPAAAPQRRGEAAKLTFDSQESLAVWTIAGDTAIDSTKGHGDKGGSLKVGPK